jgi:hypothetical protein
VIPWESFVSLKIVGIEVHKGIDRFGIRLNIVWCSLLIDGSGAFVMWPPSAVDHNNLDMFV